MSIAPRGFVERSARFHRQFRRRRAIRVRNSTSPISGSRMPVQMMIADRTLDPPGDFGSEHTDALSTRDMGWLMGWSCDAQEAFDNHLIAYRIGEDPRVAFAPDGLPGRVLRLSYRLRRRFTRPGAGEGIPAALQASLPARSAPSGIARPPDHPSRAHRFSSSVRAPWKIRWRSLSRPMKSSQHLRPAIRP